MEKKEKNKDPHRPQHIAWRDGQKKEIVMKCLNHPLVLAEMPDESKGNAGEMVLWAVRKIRELAISGALTTNEPRLFAKDPEEVKGLNERIQALEHIKDEYYQMYDKMKELGSGVFEMKQNEDGTCELSLIKGNQILEIEAPVYEEEE